MYILRKFFNAETATETGTGGEETQVLDKVETKTEETTKAPSIAELMAKGGQKNENGKTVEKPKAIEQKEETKTTETETPAATATDEGKVDKVETKVQSENEVKETPKTQTEEKAAPAPSFQEVLKQQQPKAVLEALGFVPEVADLADRLSNFKGEELQRAIGYFDAVMEGKGNEYLKEASTDYAKMLPEDVMRHQLQKEYPKATPATLEALFQKKIVQEYNLDSTDDDEVATGRMLLEAEADKLRDGFIENQKKYTTPKPSPKEEKTEAQPTPEEEVQKQVVANVTKKYRDSAYVQGVLSTGVLTLGKGAEAFNFPLKVDDQGTDKNIAADILDIAINGDQTGALLFDITKDATGKPIYDPKLEHNILVATVMKYGKEVIDEAIKFGKSLGAAKLRDQITNAKEKDNTTNHTSEAQGTSIAAMLAKGGKRVNS